MTDEELKALLEELEGDIRDLGIEVARLAKSEPKP
jgi:hypothetical protein